jgi:hypothetical protein
MMRFVSSALPAALVLLAACARATVSWHPSLVSHVPDSAHVRVALRTDEPPVRGVALDWQRQRPRMITAPGDTIVVPEGAKLEVRLREKGSRATSGGVIGYLLGVGVSYAYCPPPKSHCGEQDPTPLLVAGLGALIGSRFKADQWVRVRWDAP